jgi:GAF domain-containing protein
MAEVQLLDSPSHEQLEAQLHTLLDPSEPLLTQMANMASLLYWSIPDLNWVGFYIRRAEQLFLGPFQGRPACTVIPVGRGVCGSAAAEGLTLHVPDVHAFPGHIACDHTSNSEIVVPLSLGDAVWGVLDIDSPVKNRFSTADVAFFSRSGKLLEQRCQAAGGALFPLDKA